MITIQNNEMAPIRLYLLKNEKLIVKNKQVDELIFTFYQQKSKPLKLDEQFKFDCKVGNHFLFCESLNLKAEIYVFNNLYEKEKFISQEKDFSGVKSEKQYDSDDVSNENDEVMSEEISTFTQKKKKLLNSTTVETSSTQQSKMENQSTTSEACEYFLLEKNNKQSNRKSSDPVIQTKELIQNPKTQKGSKTNHLQQISKYIKQIQNEQISITQEQKNVLLKNWNQAKYIYEYLIFQYSQQ